MQATLLVNPRPTHEEFVRYSFPSKTMEYMSTGTPLLTTCLPGMPEEYRPYVYLIREETPQGIARALKETLSQSDQALFDKGMAARNFILKEKNNVIQAGKILSMLESIDIRIAHAPAVAVQHRTGNGQGKTLRRSLHRWAVD